MILYLSLIYKVKVIVASRIWPFIDDIVLKLVYSLMEFEIIC